MLHLLTHIILKSLEMVNNWGKLKFQEWNFLFLLGEKRKKELEKMPT